MHLRYEEQGGLSFFDWAKEIKRFLPCDNPSSLAREWNAAIEEIRDLTNDTAFCGAGEVHPDTPAESLWLKLAPDKSDTRCSGLVIADTGDTYLADMVTAAALQNFDCRLDCVSPAQALNALKNHGPIIAIILGGFKTPGIKQLQENLLPAASNIGRLYDNHEYHTSFLWSVPASEGAPQIIWVASGGLDGTYEGVWNLVNVEWAGLTDLSQMRPTNGVELPHLAGNSVDLCKRSTQAFIEWKRQDKPVVTPGIARKLYRDLQALAESGKTTPQPCRECQVKDICKANLGTDGLGPIMRAPKVHEAVANIRRLTTVEEEPPSLLIEGETGVGKDLAARYVHYLGKRKEGPFLHMNCANISRELADSLLFGHVKGAFTGAGSDRLGAFRAADGGTLFLDEITELPLDIQAQLLVALQNRYITPVGMDHPINVDVHVIAATNKSLDEQVRSRQFRADLKYRLNEYRIDIAPLRERPEDMPCLIARILSERFAHGPVEQVLPLESFRHLLSYRWPGNVREFQSVLRSAGIRTGKGRPILPEHLQIGATPPAKLAAHSAHQTPTEDVELQRLEKEYVSSASSEDRDSAAQAFRWRISRNNPSDDVRIARAKVLVELANAYSAIRPVAGTFTIPKGTRIAESGELVRHHLARKLKCSEKTVRKHHRCDLYSLGVVLYRLLTGQATAQGTSPAEVLRSICWDVPPSPRALDSAIPEHISQACMRLLVKQREGRFQSAQEFIQAVQGVPQQASGSFCLSCGANVPQDANFCSSCGASLDGSLSNRTQCIACGSPINGSAYCPGCNMPFSQRNHRLECKTGPLTGLTLLIPEGIHVVGRNELAPRDHHISRKHLSLACLNENVTVQDAGSTNKTFVNGREVAGPVALQPGQELVIAGNTAVYTRN